MRIRIRDLVRIKDTLWPVVAQYRATCNHPQAVKGHGSKKLNTLRAEKNASLINIFQKRTEFLRQSPYSCQISSVWCRFALLSLLIKTLFYETDCMRKLAEESYFTNRTGAITLLLLTGHICGLKLSKGSAFCDRNKTKLCPISYSMMETFDILTLSITFTLLILFVCCQSIIGVNESPAGVLMGDLWVCSLT